MGIAGAQTARQALRAGLVDEIFLHLVPVVLGSGIGLFRGLSTSLRLQPIGVVAGEGVTHLRYQVVRSKGGRAV